MTDFERDNAKDPVIRRELEDEMVAEIAEWANRMGYHKANEVTVPLHRELRQDFIHVAEMVIRKVPQGRERALALTHLQTALMWANAGVAIELAPLALDD
jgi:hypothetical protein